MGTGDPAGGCGGGLEAAEEDRAVVQRGAIAQCPGVPAASGLLSGQSGSAEGRASGEDGPGQAQTQRDQPWTETENLTLGNLIRFSLRNHPDCAIVDETFQVVTIITAELPFIVSSLGQGRGRKVFALLRGAFVVPLTESSLSESRNHTIDQHSLPIYEALQSQ